MTVTHETATDLNTSMLNVFNPATGELLESVPINGPEEVAEAVHRARDAFPNWRDTPAEERVRILLTFVASIRENRKELAELLSVEGGQTIWEAELEIEYVAHTFELYAGIARHHGGLTVPSNTATTENAVRKDPVGVIAAIVPFNFPSQIWAWKTGPALAGGNVVIVKPSPETPLSVLRLHELLMSAGLPAGVHQVVVGGAETGHALVSNPEVDGIGFTGSIPAGRAILKSAAENVTRICTLELSGQDPFIVADDVDIDLAAQLVAFGAYLHAGQVCVSTERVYVAESIFGEFTSKLVEHSRAIRLGNPLERTTDMGPLMNKTTLERTATFVAAAVASGGTVRTGGRVASEHGELFYEPTVLTGLTHDQLKDMGEIFGPVVPLVPVANYEEALELANDSTMGLGACVATNSLERAMLASRHLRFGSVWINSALGDTLGGPFGGYRQSGQGRELGVEGYEAYLETKHVTIEHKLNPSRWWFEHRDA